MGNLKEIFRKKLPVWFVSGVIFANGLISILQVLLVRFSHEPRVFNVILPFGLHHWGRSLTLIFGFSLIYLSYNLLYRKKAAWGLAVIISILLTFVHLIRGHNALLAIAPAVALLILFIWRKRFTVRIETSSITQGLFLMFASLFIAITYGTLGFRLLDKRDFEINFRLTDSLIRTLREFTLVGNSDLVARTRHARWFLESLRLFGLVASLLGAYSIFRPISYRLRTLPHEKEIAAGILNTYGKSSLDYFKLWDDKSYFFWANSQCFIAYKVALGVAISLGDPVGSGHLLKGTVISFLQHCSDNGWTVAFHQVLPKHKAMYQKLGFGVLKVGEEAIVDLGHFRKVTSQDKKFRKIGRKFEEEGFEFLKFTPPHLPALLVELEKVSNEWLALPGRRERTFTLGKFERSYIAHSTIFAVRNPKGEIIAFVNQIHSYKIGEATVDLMRHKSDAPHGTMDFLFLKLLMLLKEEGYKYFNLGLVPFAGVGEKQGSAAWEKAIHLLYENLNRFFSYKGLRAYKEKFEPEWENRFLVFQGGPIGLLKTALALVRTTEGS